MRFAAALLALALVLCSCGQAAPDSSAPPPEEGTSAPAAAAPASTPVRSIRIPYDPEDSLNPFTCSTLQNYYAAGLLYDTLVALDVMGNPQNRLAQEVTTQEGRCIVRLRTDAYFADGSRVTARDVAYSALFARGCPRFTAQLAGVAEVLTPDQYTVVFVLSAPDQYFDRSLTFPVVKEGSAGEIQTPAPADRTVESGETGEEEVPASVPAFATVTPRADGELPVGGGRFLLEEDGVTMTRNSRYHTPVKNLRTVRLVDAGGLAAQSGAILAGELDLTYSNLRGTVDLSAGNASRQVLLSDLVFLGINSQRLDFSAELRTTLSALIDRDALARRAYLGFAAAAWSPIRQSFDSTTAGEETPDSDSQGGQLDALGYEQRDEEGWRTIRGQRFTLRLLVNSDSTQREAAAGIIAGAFEAEGIQLVVESVPFAEYTQRIAEGNYDLYLGELRIPPNLDLSTLIAPHPAVGPGCAQDEELLAVYRQVKEGKGDLSDLDSAFRRSMPAIPLVYRRGIVAFSRDFSANIVATEQDIFYNIGDW